ncbi:glycosyltransferase [Pseudomonas sp. zfem001]|uniref:glycosyltransferase n=1 Tax=unclassified Pseudomonas TaxID=196821 RepID=UPI000F773B84|nr:MULTISPECIES: glycosyltransferase [unclassified Pseudomonas]MDU9407056.1 glycosyltransferase [Pseudomonas sp. zfem001]RRV29003.1 glycosyltransferase [Pseudomonas sp. o96-267]
MTEQLPLVTVVIASYNHAPYIEQCILSVVQQTYPHIELLVVDDGSTDDSVARIEQLQREHGFELRVQQNKGLTHTLNEAIARAKGSLIAPFGSDDIMVPERIAKQVAYMQDKPEVGICAGNIELIDSDGQLFPEPRQRRDIAFRRLDFDDVFMERKPYPPAPTLLFRKEALEQVGGFDPQIRLEDLLIELKITHAGYYIDCLGEVLAQYRKHDSNSSKNTPFMVESILRTYALFKDHPQYEFVRTRFLSSMFLKCSNRDRDYAKQLLRQIPFRSWNKKTWRGLGRLLFSPLEKN